jgi:hypothetical protein
MGRLTFFLTMLGRYSILQCEIWPMPKAMAGVALGPSRPLAGAAATDQLA